MTETTGSAVRQTTTAYDDAGRPDTVAMTGGIGQALPATTTYAPDTGEATSEKPPGGYTLSQEIDPTGSARSRTYTRDSDATVVLTDTVETSVHSQVTARSGWSNQQYRYDAAGRLAEVDDTADTVCTRRGYTFGARSTRTALTTATAAPGVDCSSTGGTTGTYTYDSAERLVDTGYSYDAFGRTATAPGHGTLSCYANDLVHWQTVGTVRQTWQRDPELRVSAWTTGTGSCTSWTRTSSEVNHYDSDSDSPRWVVEES